uniref:Cytochrome P450 2J2-like n=1 Tax=Scleropages formosus TaxID=113540 RepID=A0A8C9UYU3_SCLFO
MAVNSLLECLDIKSFLLFVTVFLLLTEILKNKNPPNFPPGPWPLPFLGNVFIVQDPETMAKKHRRFANTYFKSFGEGRKTIELYIQQECNFLCHAIEERGNFTPTRFLINNAVSNVICTLVFGHRYDYSDADFQELLRLEAECIHLVGTTHAQLYNDFPRLMKFLPGPHQIIFSNYTKIIDFLRKEIEKHKKDWDPSDPRDFVDAYIGKIEEDDPEAGFNLETLTICIVDLFEAGTESSSTTLRWGLLFMMKYPDVQKKVQAEIDRVIGQSRLPTIADRVKMPYTDAVVHEIQRKADILPLGFPKIASKDTSIGGYFIPKGTIVTANLTSVLNDKNEWETPGSFNPGHFLDSQGQFRRRDAFYPFSAGMRVCLGEQMARMELFLFFTSLLQRFTFSPPPGVEPDLEGVLGFTYAPKPFKMCILPR